MKYFEMHKKRYTPKMLEARKGAIENSKTTWWSSTEMCEKYHDCESSFWSYISFYYGNMKVDEAYQIYIDLWMDNMIQLECSRVDEEYTLPGSSEVMDALNKIGGIK